MLLHLTIQAYRLAAYLPDRKIQRRGPAPIKKEALVLGLLFWLRTGCPWRDVPHAATVRRYFRELHRRGYLSSLLRSMLYVQHRPDQAIIDATNIDTWKGAPRSQYSGKYHNYCIKLTLSVTPEKHLLDYSIDNGSVHDSKILDNMLSKCEMLPYELFLDKGYESYMRRRQLQKDNCQVRMEQKHYTNNRKRGPRFRFSKSHSVTRLNIERFFAHLKNFNLFRFFRFRKFSICNMAISCALLLLFVS